MLSAVAHWEVSFNAAMRDDDVDYPPLNKLYFEYWSLVKTSSALPQKSVNS